MPDSFEFDLKLNDREIVGALTEPFYQTNELLARQFTKELTSDKWAWPTQPSPRDIVDTGQLRDSYDGERVPEASGPAYLHSYNTSYALAVHEGAVFKDGHSMPARPWMRQALKDMDLAKVFTALAKARLGRVQ